MGRRWARWKPFWSTLVILVVAGAALAGVAYYLYVPHASGVNYPPPTGPPPTSRAVVDGVDLIFSYTVSGNETAGYLSPSPECDACPVNLTRGSAWTFSFNLTNTDANRSHTITAIDLASPFNGAAVQPSLPFTLGSRTSAVFTISVTLPSAPGYYSLSGSIDTT